MYFAFLRLVLARAFHPATRVTDGLQIVAASAIPAAAMLAGVNMPSNMGNEALGYIGLATLAFVVIRLLWAPYSIWKDETVKVALLEGEMADPVHQIKKSQSTIIAANRLQLAGAIWQDYFYMMGVMIGDTKKLPKKFGKERFRLMAETDFSPPFRSAMSRLAELAVEIDEGRLQEGREKDISRVISSSVAYLHGTITGEDLLRRLPPSIESETQR